MDEDQKKRIIYVLGLALVIEGLFIVTDWSQYGIPSLILDGTHIHHWMAGFVMMVWGVR